MFRTTRSTRITLHAALLTGASAFAMALSSAAFAQSSGSVATGQAVADATKKGDIETVVVTGTRASLKTSQGIKKNSDQVVDSVTAVDIGSLPDRNVADALQRVPGVTLQRTDANRDPVRYGGTGNGIYIRGLAWVQSLTNGRDEFSAANGRALSFADVSADLLSGVDVYKNPDAEMIEGGVGGTVNLKTRKPFDQDGELLAVSADYTDGDLINKGTPSVNGLYSNRWSTPMGEIGALISVDYQDQTNRTNGFSLDHYDCVDVTLIGSAATRSQRDSDACNSIPEANRRYIPDYLGWRQIDWEQKRLAFDGSVQWRPNAAWEVTAEGFYSKADPHDTEHTLPFVPQPENYLGEGSYDYHYNKNGVWTGGTINDIASGGIDTRIGQHHDTNADFSLNAKFNPNNNWSFSADAQYAESSATNFSMTAFTDKMDPFDCTDGSVGTCAATGGATNGYSGENLTINLSPTGVPQVSLSDPAGMKQRDNYYYGAAMDHMEDNFAHSWAYRADGTYTFDDNSWLKTVDFGFRGDDKQAVTRQTGYNWSILSHQGWGGGPTQFLNSTGYDANHQNAGLPNQVGEFDFGSFFGGNGPSAWFINSSLLRQPTSNIYSYLVDTESMGWGWVPYATQHGCPAGQDVKCLAIYGSGNPEADNVSAGINNQHETTYAGYTQVNYSHENFLGTGVPVDGNIGVRVIQTQDATAAGKMILPAVPGLCVTDPTLGDCPTAIQFINGGGSQTLSPATDTYTDVLPSFNFRAHMSDELQLRLAFSQGIVRPDFANTQNFQTLGMAVGPDGKFDDAPNNMPFSGSAGNTNLKPMHANNYDASLEWYFAPTGSMTLALFHKDLSDYFLTGTVGVPVTRNGVTETFGLIETVNGSKGKVEGFELAYQQYYDSLPGPLSGLGLQANYTKIYNSGGANPTVNLFETVEIANAQKPLPLEGMSPDSYNVALLYQKFGIDARLAYNWRSTFLLTSSAANVNQPVWSENYGQLDGSIFYTFMDHYKIGIQATNLLKPTTHLDVGYADFHPRYDWIETDRKIALVLRAQW